MTRSRSLGVVFLGAFIVLSHQRLACAQTQAANPPAYLSTPVNPQDADSLLRIAIPRTMRNHRKATAFTYRIDYRNRNFSPHGKLLIDYTAKYEVIFVGGLPYRRLTEENREKLSSKDAVDEQKRYDRAFAERSLMTLDQKRDYLKRPWNVDIPLPQLTSLFNNSLVGDDMVDGRPAIIVESTPRADARPSDEEQRRALHKSVKLWIDREDLIVSRLEATLVADDASMKKGTTDHIEYQRKDGLWLPVRSDIKFTAMSGTKLIDGETTEENGDFRRFHVDVRLLEPEDTARETSPAQ